MDLSHLVGVRLDEDAQSVELVPFLDNALILSKKCEAVFYEVDKINSSKFKGLNHIITTT